MLNLYKKSENYIRHGKNFAVEITHWRIVNFGDTEFYMTNHGPNRWNLYCYIYPEHPLFNKLVENEEEKHNIEMHGGVTYFQKYFDNDMKITSIKLGCDYQHLWDHYSFTEKIEDFTKIINDAEDLFNFLTDHKNETRN